MKIGSFVLFLLKQDGKGTENEGDGGFSYPAAVEALKVAGAGGGLAVKTKAEADRSHGFLGGAATGARNAGCGYADLRAASARHAACHFSCRLLTDGAVGGKRFGRDVYQVDLCFVGIGDEGHV